MKKLIAIVLILCIVPVCASADDLTLFSFYAGVCGEKALGERSEKGVFSAGDCAISFEEENGAITQVIIVGDGTSFLGYAMAAIMLFDPNQDHFNENAGDLYSAFIHSKTDGIQSIFTMTGKFFILNKHDDSFFFTIGR